MQQHSVAVVTGSTSGIGLGIARSLAAHGHHLVLNGLSTPLEADALCAALAQEFGIETAYSGADLSHADGVAGLIDTAQARFGRIDVLVNNAGIQFTAPVHEFPVERWDAILALNLSAAFHAIRRALPGMLERGHGRIVNIASVHGLVGSVHKAAYVAAKHGLVGLGKVVALETAGSGVTCNTVCPGWVLTPLVEKQIAERAAMEGIPYAQASGELLEEKQPSKQFVTPEQLGELVAFLASPAAAQLTGQAIAVDGAWTAR
ncbi:3-hydroxybutyrate dehydrogenase [Plasticicumulans lactativorans]|uniref:3-hydroxybutyrate dehydrogenase n=1 Tax=Plasticicumulans lactativorans TaxID=1133106 RepID=A0A4R2L8X8_9GAMM|nr:3-hydroxybutyrate dehydrogenase [Plasticicumulans lactativorans]TCO80566.1 3-hydroxybutyrate dehydrogenase [Plasticicumulans lactativorans]